MTWSPEDRRKFLRGLDDSESALLVFYKYLLYILIPSVTLLAAVTSTLPAGSPGWFPSHDSNTVFCQTNRLAPP